MGGQGDGRGPAPLGTPRGPPSLRVMPGEPAVPAGDAAVASRGSPQAFPRFAGSEMKPRESADPPSHTCLPTQHFTGAAITSPPLCKHLRSGWTGASTSADPEFGSGHWDWLWGQPRADRPHRLPGRFSQHLAGVLTTSEAFLAVLIPISLFQ